MGVRLSDMKSKVKETHIEWDGQTVDFAYKPNQFTVDLADQLAKDAEGENIGAVSNMLAPLVEWWDVLDDNDVRIPATAENMRQFPLPFLTRIMKAMVEDQNPDAGESEG